MIRDVDGLTSATLKHLRERWWDDAFTEFVKDTLQPRPGRRILDVGCGTGTAEVKLSRLRLTQVDLVAVDLLADRVRAQHQRALRFRRRLPSAVPRRHLRFRLLRRRPAAHRRRSGRGQGDGARDALRRANRRR